MPSWIQDPETGQFIPKEQYRRERRAAPMISPDIEPFVSPVDGERLYSRRQLRAHNARHGVTDLRDYGPDWFEKKARERERELKCESRRAKRGRIEAIERAIHRHESNRHDR